ncbi:serine/threonine-protein kinase [Planomonospora sp. ID82291]|uniref:serine/threonine-protein kinase n=1 Tax=Planomonospora sp. ID82291 TaxID=2738136 RepID=UPI0018C44A00|nr:serine/threonine-protein kinase [Planomonospora sp. ID82291]MBG0813200.1 protein kinase [Planomonospora sp. ID82291]
MNRIDTRVLAGRYRLLRPLSESGGIVWLAADEVLHRDVAVREVRIPSGLGPVARQAFHAAALRETNLAVRIKHPSIVAVHDVVVDGGPWIVMELLHGASLEETVRERGPLPPHQALRVGAGVLGALAAVHAAGVLHRGLAPGNVFLTEDGRALLTDFGIVLTETEGDAPSTGRPIGAPGYTAPERLRGALGDARSDLWSLGATLYFAVEGTPPHPADTPADTIRRTLAEPPRRPEQAGALGPLLMRMLAPSPAARPSAETVARMLDDVAQGRSTAALPPASAPAASATLPASSVSAALPASSVSAALPASSVSAALPTPAVSAAFPTPALRETPFPGPATSVPAVPGPSSATSLPAPVPAPAPASPAPASPGNGLPGPAFPATSLPGPGPDRADDGLGPVPPEHALPLPPVPVRTDGLQPDGLQPDGLQPDGLRSGGTGSRRDPAAGTSGVSPEPSSGTARTARTPFAARLTRKDGSPARWLRTAGPLVWAAAEITALAVLTGVAMGVTGLVSSGTAPTPAAELSERPGAFTSPVDVCGLIPADRVRQLLPALAGEGEPTDEGGCTWTSPGTGLTVAPAGPAAQWGRSPRQAHELFVNRRNGTIPDGRLVWSRSSVSAGVRSARTTGPLPVKPVGDEAFGHDVYENRTTGRLERSHVTFRVDNLVVEVEYTVVDGSKDGPAIQRGAHTAATWIADALRQQKAAAG